MRRRESSRATSSGLFPARRGAARSHGAAEAPRQPHYSTDGVGCPWSVHLDCLDDSLSLLLALAGARRARLAGPGRGAGRSRPLQRQDRHARDARRRCRRSPPAAAASSRSAPMRTCKRYIGQRHGSDRPRRAVRHARLHRRARALHRRGPGAAAAQPDEGRRAGTRLSRWSRRRRSRPSLDSGSTAAAGTRRNGSRCRRRTSKDFRPTSR